jgi:hypothetical protein
MGSIRHLLATIPSYSPITCPDEAFKKPLILPLYSSALLAATLSISRRGAHAPDIHTRCTLQPTITTLGSRP